MKYKISWDINDFIESISFNSKEKAFAMVYGVYDFQIKYKKIRIKSTSFISRRGNYDFQYHYFLQCFLSPKQINKVYDLIVRDGSFV